MALQIVVSFGILSRMRAFVKPVCILLLCLLLIAFLGCEEKAAEAYENTVAQAAVDAASLPTSTVRMVPITMAPTWSTGRCSCAIKRLALSTIS